MAAVATLVAVAAVSACTSTAKGEGTPKLAPRDTTLTTAKPTKQDLANSVSLSGKVTLNPIFGLVAPVGGEVRYFDVKPQKTAPTKPTRVATVWAGGKAHYVEIPAGSVLAGRLAEDRSTVAAGAPIVAAKRLGYGLVAEIDAGQAYQIAEAPATAQGQIKNGPGPFECTVLGTIAALPPGTIPAEPTQASSPSKGTTVEKVPVAPDRGDGEPEGAGGGTSEPTGMRLVCVPGGDVKLINGASATVRVVTKQVTNVLVLPVEAVAGSQGKGKVSVLKPDGGREIKEVELGLTDGKVIEIKSGLNGDETVAVPGPNLPDAPAGGGGGKGER